MISNDEKDYRGICDTEYKGQMLRSQGIFESHIVNKHKAIPSMRNQPVSQISQCDKTITG